MKKRWWAALSLILVLALTAGCQSGAESSSATEESTIYGQVTAIDGNSITLSLGTVTQNQMPSGGRQDSGGASAMPSDGSQPSGEMPSMPSDAQENGQPENGTQTDSSTQTDGSTQDGEAPSMPSDGQRDAQLGNGGQGSGSGIELTGESLTITLSDSTVITIQSSGEGTSGSLSDIAVGDILSVTMSGDTVTAITVMQLGGVMPSGGMPDGSMPSGSVPSGSVPSDSVPTPTE